MDLKSNGGNAKLFAIIGTILASFSLIFSMIPCVGTYAFVPSLLGASFCLIAYFILKKERMKTGLAMAGSIIGIIAICISLYQFYTYQEIFETKRKIDEGIQSVGEKLNDEVLEKTLEDFKEALDSADILRDSIRIIEPVDSLNDADSLAD